MALTIILPTYNEAKNIGKLIHEIEKYICEEDEIIVVKKIKTVWNAIESGIFLPASNFSWRCKICSYRSHCIKWHTQ